jgi:hypothetical protein
MQLLYRMQITCSKDDYVIAAYDRSCYIGNVLEDDVSDKTLHIAFMVVKRFHWPNKQDTLWINSKYIIRKIQHPIATGKGGRLFRNIIVLATCNLHSVQELHCCHQPQCVYHTRDDQSVLASPGCPTRIQILHEIHLHY